MNFLVHEPFCTADVKNVCSHENFTLSCGIVSVTVKSREKSRSLCEKKTSHYKVERETAQTFISIRTISVFAGIDIIH